VTDLIKGLNAEFIPAQWDGKDSHGIKVVGKTVLVLMDQASPKSSGEVLFTEDVVERLSSGAESGLLVAVSAGAFLLNEDMTPWQGEKPRPGDRVYIAKYAGQMVRGKDGKIYRLMDYGNIGAVYDSVTMPEPPKAKVTTKKKGRTNGRSKRSRTRRR
jgi:chaperonin GroES